MPDRSSRLPPVVKSLGAVSFLNDLASEMVYPLLPALVTGVLERVLERQSSAKV